MATPTIQEITTASNGLTPSYAAGSATETYLIANNGAVFLHVKKTGAGDCVVTVPTLPACNSTRTKISGAIQRSTLAKRSGAASSYFSADRIG